VVVRPARPDNERAAPAVPATKGV